MRRWTNWAMKWLMQKITAGRSEIIDGKHFLPQHRERIVLVGFRRDLNLKPILPCVISANVSLRSE
ncbi:hypothetical protein ACLK19_13175 [Escherichia coli]